MNFVWLWLDICRWIRYITKNFRSSLGKEGLFFWKSCITRQYSSLCIFPFSSNFGILVLFTVYHEWFYFIALNFHNLVVDFNCNNGKDNGLVEWTMNQAVQVQALTRVIVLCSWARSLHPGALQTTSPAVVILGVRRVVKSLVNFCLIHWGEQKYSWCILSDYATVKQLWLNFTLNLTPFLIITWYKCYKKIYFGPISMYVY